MNTSITTGIQARANERGHARIVIIAVICFAIGVGAGGWWFSRRPLGEVALSDAQQQETGNQVVMEPAVRSHPPQQLAVETTDPAIIAAVNRAIPNVTLASVEQGTLILRKAAIAEFEEAVQDLQARQKKAEQKFIEAQSNRDSEQEMIAARELQQLQAEQMEKLKEIAANSKAQIDALKQLKGQSP